MPRATLAATVYEAQCVHPVWVRLNSQPSPPEGSVSTFEAKKQCAFSGPLGSRDQAC